MEKKRLYCLAVNPYAVINGAMIELDKYIHGRYGYSYGEDQDGNYLVDFEFVGERYGLISVSPNCLSSGTP